MQHRSKLFAGGVCTALVLAFSAGLIAASVTVNGITLEYPDYPSTAPLLHCEPWNDPTANTVRLSGVPENSNVTLQFNFSAPGTTVLTFAPPIVLNNVGGDPFTVAIPYPQDTMTWPYQNGSTRGITVAVSIAVTLKDGTRLKQFAGKKWTVFCTPDEPEDPLFEGCTLGYWKQEQHFDAWQGYLPTDSYDTVFGVDSSLNPPGPAGELANPSLLDALEIGGGGENGMARQAVAALLNAASDEVNFPMTVGEVLAAVTNAYATGNFDAAHALFEGHNEIVTVVVNPDGTVTRYHCEPGNEVTEP